MTIKLEVGTKLQSIATPGRNGQTYRSNAFDIVLGELPGPSSFFLVAIATLNDTMKAQQPALKDWPVTIIPLHMAESFDVIDD